MKNEIARTVVEAEDHDENNGHVLLGQGSTIFSEAGRVMAWHICVLDSCLINFFNQSRYRLKRFKKTGSAVSGPGITYVNDLVPRIPLSFQRKGRRETATGCEKVWDKYFPAVSTDFQPKTSGKVFCLLGTLTNTGKRHRNNGEKRWTNL